MTQPVVAGDTEFAVSDVYSSGESRVDATTAPGLGFPIAPMGLTEKLDAAFRFLRVNLRLIAVSTLTVCLPFTVLGALVSRGAATNFWSEVFNRYNHPSTNPTAGLGQLGGVVVAYLAGAIPLFLCGFGAAHIARRALKGEAADYRSTMRAMARGGVRILPAWLVSRVALGLGLITCGVVLVPMLALLFGLLSTCSEMEGLGPWASLRRSAELVKGRFGGALALNALSWLVTAILVASMAALPVILLLRFGNSLDVPVWYWPLSAAIGLMNTFLSATIAAAVALVLYVDCRCRVEGWDLAVATNRVFRAPGRRAVGAAAQDAA